jgi:hypothetical protein
MGDGFHLETQFDHLANAYRDLFERSRLSMTTLELRNRGKVETLVIALDYDIEFASQFRLQSLLPIQP